MAANLPKLIKPPSPEGQNIPQVFQVLLNNPEKFGEIAEAVGCDQATIQRVLNDFMQNGKLAESHKAAADHLVGLKCGLPHPGGDSGGGGGF